MEQAEQKAADERRAKEAAQARAMKEARRLAQAKLEVEGAGGVKFNGFYKRDGERNAKPSYCKVDDASVKIFWTHHYENYPRDSYDDVWDYPNLWAFVDDRDDRQLAGGGVVVAVGQPYVAEGSHANGGPPVSGWEVTHVGAAPAPRLTWL